MLRIDAGWERSMRIMTWQPYIRRKENQKLRLKKANNIFVKITKIVPKNSSHGRASPCIPHLINRRKRMHGSHSRRIHMHRSFEKKTHARITFEKNAHARITFESHVPVLCYPNHQISVCCSKKLTVT